MFLKFALLATFLFVGLSLAAPATIGSKVLVDLKPLHNYPLPGVNDKYPVAKYDTEQLCNAVGRNTGCSGCQLGTKNLCSWVRYDVKLLSDSHWAAEYKCIPTVQADEEDIMGISTPSGHLCPADPTKEPILDARISYRVPATALEFSVTPISVVPGWIAPVSNLVESALGPDDVDHYTTLEQSSRILSKSYDTQLFENAKDDAAKITVDRTSLYGEAGFAYTSGYAALARKDIDCDELASIDRFDITRLAGMDDLEYLVSERMRYCFKVHLATFYSIRCPVYGVASSGICESSFKKTVGNCGFIDQNIFRSVNDAKGPVFDRLSTFLVDVVSDDTPFCTEAAPLWPSGEVFHLAGLDRKVEVPPS